MEKQKSNVVFANFKKPRLVVAGSELDKIVANRVFEGVLRPYSTDPDSAVFVCEVIQSQGYEMEFEEDGQLVICTLVRDSVSDFAGWGLTYEEAVCRSALRLLGGNGE